MKRSKRKRKNKLLIPIILLLLILFGLIMLKVTETGTYTIYDHGQEIKSYHHFPIAQMKMKSLKSNEAYIVNENGKALSISEGFVNFNTKDISENTIFEDGYLNGNYGADGLYIKTNLWGTKVQFMISGVKGWVNVEDIQLFLFDDSLYSSYYINKDSTLYHIIVTDMIQGNQAGWPIGVAPDFMEQDIPYYSYDGQVFYKTLEDLSNNTNRVNKKRYYNFYQYVSHKSNTNIEPEALNSFLNTIKGINSKATSYPCEYNESVLYDSASYFYEAQEEYGMNAAMMMAVALNESGYGQSQYAIENHNLFGHAVYDASPDSANSYNSIQDCINAHASRFLLEGYANKKDDRYNGSWFGNKKDGINVKYASDPYWGEKAASFYYQLDMENNFVDYNSKKLNTKLQRD